MALTMGLGMVMTKSLKSLRMTRLRRRVLRRALPEQRGGGGGELAINTPSARFCNQVFVNSVFARFHKCKQHVLSQAFANMLSQKYICLASFRKYDFAGFSKPLAHFGIYSFAVFHSVLPFLNLIILRTFAKFCKVPQIDFRKIYECEKSRPCVRFS